MEDLKQDLELLFELQNYDIKISDVNKQISLAPSSIEQKNIILEDKKAELSEEKKKYVDLVSLKKEKESLLADKEKAIEKHSMELNTVKSNDTYKALLLEIEKAKADKNILEDELLALMEKVDEESAKIKTVENEFQKFEENIKKEITDIKNNANKLKEEAIALENKREEHKLKVSKSVLSHYERLKEGRDGRGLAIVDGESCGGCGMVLRTQLINQALKGQELVFCDNCSRILFKK
ncbi:zinc ribbon domain-containing protein [Candidatus Endomicrobiellum devescovinae]|jgi:predicted  nucleic acid-binding Zn-ribbon protein|uniref:zinc ribbon domain-containing protein n=1 Tax=Candidatus Endomicrobiellum devescovinae TaxID=3242322 RepID=UPI002831DA0D|nr:C4-type zinc ribbon domain-containing protein [Endomicrobium sp.]